MANAKVTEYLNENFICTYLKVGTFQIINNQKVGGNVASYFVLPDANASVMHAIPGQVNGDKFLSEARFAYEIRKTALTSATNLGTGKTDMIKYQAHIKKAHSERYSAEAGGAWSPVGKQHLPSTMPRNVGQQAQVHWMLAREPLPKLEMMYPVVWRQVLNEKLSDLPVAKR